MLYIKYSAQEIGPPNDFYGMTYSPFSNEEQTVVNTRRFVYTTGIIHMGWNDPEYTWEFSSNYLVEGENIHIEQVGEFLEVSYIDHVDLFPIKFIKPIDWSKVYTFADVKPEMVHITKFKPNDIDYLEGTIKVHVDAYDNERDPVSDEKVFDVYVFANYNEERDIFVDEVDKRRYVHYAPVS